MTGEFDKGFCEGIFVAGKSGVIRLVDKSRHFRCERIELQAGFEPHAHGEMPFAALRRGVGPDKLCAGFEDRFVQGLCALICLCYLTCPERPFERLVKELRKVIAVCVERLDEAENGRVKLFNQLGKRLFCRILIVSVGVVVFVFFFRFPGLSGVREIFKRIIARKHALLRQAD